MTSSPDQWQIRHSDGRCLGIYYNPSQKKDVTDLELFQCPTKPTNTSEKANIFFEWTLKDTLHISSTPFSFKYTYGSLTKQSTKHNNKNSNDNRVSIVMDLINDSITQLKLVSQISEPTSKGHEIRNQDFFGVVTAQVE